MKKILVIVSLLISTQINAAPFATCSCSSGSMIVTFGPGGTPTYSCSGGGRLNCSMR